MKKKRLVKNKIIKNPVIINILSALGVAVFGFILLNLAFLFDFIYQSIIRGFVMLFIQINQDTNLYWIPLFFHGSFVIMIGLISWFIFRSRLKEFYKIIYMTVPVAVVLATMGMFFNHWPIIVYTLGSLIVISLLYYFYKTKKYWLYYYTVLLVSITLAVYTLSGGEI
jgi:hypothetical protein